MVSPEIQSEEAIVKRMRELQGATTHLARYIDPQNPHAATLRLGDIARYIGLDLNTLTRVSVNPKRLPMTKSTQIALSRFWYGWDHGSLVKARVGDNWIIANPHSCNSPLAQANDANRHAPTT